MPQMMHASDIRTEQNNVPKRMAKIQTIPNSPAESGDSCDDASMVSLVKEAYRLSGLKIEYLASLADTSKGQLSGAMNGNGGFKLSWLDPWPSEFWDEFVPLVRARKERSPDAQMAAKRARLKSAINDLIDICGIGVSA